MASYTDTPLTANSFRPYVQQMPVEAMTQVGMQKQHQYDEGYQRIQNQIDKVAGLSVMRDVDKIYLKSKMNELGNNLRMVSMGDFSNYQLVNSVGGMVNQVGSDPYIQSAVSSTARIHNELNSMDTLRKAGKSDKNNEAYFYDKVLNPYLNAGLKDENGKPVSFNGSFSPYVDITSEVQKLAKDAGLDETVLQQMYATDANGKIQFDKQGRAIPARTMTQVENQSNAKALQGILTTVLSRGDVQNQMGIDAWANTRGQDPQALLAGYKQDYNNKFHAIDDQAAKWNTLLAGKVSDEQKAELQDNLKQLADTKTEYQNQLKGLTALAQSNPEAFKQQIYENNYKNSLKNMFLKTKREEKNLESPLTKSMEWEADYKLKSQIEFGNLSVAQGNLKVNQDRLNAEWPIDPTTGKRYKNDGKGKPIGGGGVFTASVSGEKPQTATQRNSDDINNLAQKSSDIGLSLMYEMYKRAPNMPKRTLQEFTDYIKDKADKDGMKPEDEVYTFLKDADNHAKLMGINLGGYDKGAIAEYIHTRANYTNRVAVTKNIDKNLNEKYGIDPKQFENDVLPASVTLPDGTTLSYSRQDMINSILYDTDPDIKREVDSQGGIDILRKHIMNVLRKKYGADDQPTSYDEYGRPIQMANRFNIDNTPEWQSLSKLQGSDKLRRYKDLADEKEKILQGFIMTDQNISIPPDAKEEDRKEAKQKLLSMVSGNQELTGENFDRDKITEALNSDSGGLTYTINKPFMEGVPTTGVAHISYKGKVYNINIENQSDLETATEQKFQGYQFNPYVAMAHTTENHSTNNGADPLVDHDAWKTCMINPSNPEYANVMSQLRGSKKYTPLGADLCLLYGGRGWSTVIYLKDKETGEPFHLELQRGDDGFPIGTEGQMITALNNLTESAVDKIIKDQNNK